MYAKGGNIRPDGRMDPRHVPDAGQDARSSTTPWDYYNVVATIPGDEAFTTKAETQVRALEVMQQPAAAGAARAPAAHARAHRGAHGSRLRASR